MTIAEAKKNKDPNCEIFTDATIVEFITQDKVCKVTGSSGPECQKTAYREKFFIKIKILDF